MAYYEARYYYNFPYKDCIIIKNPHQTHWGVIHSLQYEVVYKGHPPNKTIFIENFKRKHPEYFI